MNPNLPKSDKKRIVLIGGGFAGINFARNLKNSPYEVILLDRNNYHQFQPLLYQVSTSALEANAISFPFRKIFQGYDQMHIRICEVEEIHPNENLVLTDIGPIAYDFLVIATGTTNNFFGNTNIESKALSMKSVSEALLIRNTLLENLEQSLISEDPVEKEELLNVVIVGGGPTGTEIAGNLAEMRNHILPKDYPELNFKDMKISLVEGSPYVLNSMTPDSKAKAQEYLEKMGVNTILNTHVKDYDGKQVLLDNGNTLPTRALIWAAGVTGAKIKGFAPEVMGKGNRFLVDSHLKVKTLNNVFALGDIALVQSDSLPNGHPQLAAVAQQQGKYLSQYFKNLSKGKPSPDFSFINKGVMATVGRNKAVVELPFLNIHGFIAWVIWMVVHLILTLGVKNRLIILINWFWAYLTFDQSLRLIIKPKNKLTSEA